MFASNCFETFLFPNRDPGRVIPELEAIGQQLYEARAQYMIDANQGLTKTYNARTLKSSSPGKKGRWKKADEGQGICSDG